MLTARQRLAPRALALKKTWIMAAIMRGYKPVGEEAVIDDYTHWRAPRLRQFVIDLEDDLQDALAPFLTRPRDAIRSDATKWLAERFDVWYASGLGLFTVSTAQEFEQRVGPVRAREEIELPPYTELLLQPGSTMAFRHPEYMLARDLVFLYELFCQAEDLLSGVAWSNPPDWAKSGTENSQSLARTVVLTCFNLLESFVSGLARGTSWSTQTSMKRRARACSTPTARSVSASWVCRARSQRMPSIWTSTNRRSRSSWGPSRRGVTPSCTASPARSHPSVVM